MRRLVVEGVPIPWHEPIRGNARPDTKPPSVIAPIGAQKASGDTLDLLFSEAMRPVALRDFWQMSDSTQAPAGVWEWSAPNRARFVSEQPLALGAYRLIGQVGLLADLAGHGLADSSLTLSITVGPATAVIRGQVQAEMTGPVRVEAVGEGGRTYGALADSAGDFTLDTAHNTQAIKFLMNKKADYQKILIGILKDKNAKEIICSFPKNCEILLCNLNTERGVPSSKLKDVCLRHGYMSKEFESVGDAMEYATGSKTLVTGSFYTVSAAREFLKLEGHDEL